MSLHISWMKSLQAIPGVPRIRNNYNPATWMLEVSSTSSEAVLGIDFADIYSQSALYEWVQGTKKYLKSSFIVKSNRCLKMFVCTRYNKEQAKQLSCPPPGSNDLHFPNRFSQKSWGQFKACLWKQYLSYWRSPSYNLMRIMFMFISSLVFGALYWNQGKKM